MIWGGRGGCDIRKGMGLVWYPSPWNQAACELHWPLVDSLHFCGQRWILRAFWRGFLMTRRQICPVPDFFCQDRGMTYGYSQFWCTCEFVNMSEDKVSGPSEHRLSVST